MERLHLLYFSLCLIMTAEAWVRPPPATENKNHSTLIRIKSLIMAEDVERLGLALVKLKFDLDYLKYGDLIRSAITEVKN